MPGLEDTDVRRRWRKTGAVWLVLGLGILAAVLFLT
jgi:hypothetical protein